MGDDMYTCKIQVYLVLRKLRKLNRAQLVEIFDGQQTTAQLGTIVDTGLTTGELELTGDSIQLTAKGRIAIENQGYNQLPGRIFFRLQAQVPSQPPGGPGQEHGESGQETGEDTRQSTRRGRARMQVLKILQDAGKPLAPAIIYTLLPYSTTKSQMKLALKRLVEDGKVVVSGRTTQRRYVVAEQAHLLPAPEASKPNGSSQTPDSRPRRRQTANGKAQDPTRVFLEDNAARATAALDQYIESIADCRILDLLKDQARAAEQALARYSTEGRK